MQNDNFSIIARQLYYGIDINKYKPDVLISKFKEVEGLEFQNVTISMPASIYLQMKAEGKAIERKYLFSFKRSPFGDKNYKVGFIKVNIGQSNNIKKLLGLEWEMQFYKYEDAKELFDSLIERFIKVSKNYRINKDEIEGGLIAEFSSDIESAQTISKLTIMLLKLNGSNFVLKVFPYNSLGTK
jgi:hypothetical protein